MENPKASFRNGFSTKFTGSVPVQIAVAISVSHMMLSGVRTAPGMAVATTAVVVVHQLAGRKRLQRGLAVLALLGQRVGVRLVGMLNQVG